MFPPTPIFSLHFLKSLTENLLQAHQVYANSLLENLYNFIFSLSRSFLVLPASQPQNLCQKVRYLLRQHSMFRHNSFVLLNYQSITNCLKMQALEKHFIIIQNFSESRIQEDLNWSFLFLSNSFLFQLSLLMKQNSVENLKYLGDSFPSLYLIVVSGLS